MTNPIIRFLQWLRAPSQPWLVIKSAEGRSVVVSDEEYAHGRKRLLKAGMYDVKGRT